jgi:cobalt-zinc-cadmium efflux system membrane fusion protein
MTGHTGVNLRWTVLAASAIALLAIGAGAAYLLVPSGESRGGGNEHSAMAASADPTSAPHVSDPVVGADSPLPDVVVRLGEAAVARAGITVSPVDRGGAATSLHLPGVIEPNAYRQVVVTPLVAGRVTRVLAELGEYVRAGQKLALVFSPELAEAHAHHASAQAELEAHLREVERIEELVEIGAASRQELERAHAMHVAHVAGVETARARLELLGADVEGTEGSAADRRSDLASVPAPIAGVVTERMVNPGLNVDLATRLFTVVDLSTVWVVADLYEKDFSRVRVGSSATVTTTAYPDLVLQGRVSYIDPQVSADTRTAKVRVEVQNRRSELRLGMYADVAVAMDRTSAVLAIPRSAVQTVGDRQVVYLVKPDEPGTFIEREVKLGRPIGGQVDVLSGVQAGDVVVIEGSFFVRAERERLGLRQSMTERVAH